VPKDRHGKPPGPAMVPVWLCVRVPEKTAAGGLQRDAHHLRRRPGRRQGPGRARGGRLAAPRPAGLRHLHGLRPIAGVGGRALPRAPLVGRALQAPGAELPAARRDRHKVVYISFIRRTHFGNAHGMVRWSRGADGGYRPDLSIAGKYLAAAVEGMGKVRCLLLLLARRGQPGATRVPEGARQDRKILFSLLKPDGASPRRPWGRSGALRPAARSGSRPGGHAGAPGQARHGRVDDAGGLRRPAADRRGHG